MLSCVFNSSRTHLRSLLPVCGPRFLYALFCTFTHTTKHGYNLGELNLWCKMTVFESGTRVPLMIRVPSPGDAAPAPPARVSSSLAEAVGLFPTLVEVAAKSTPPAFADGTSLAPVLRDPAASVAKGAFSEFVKCYSCCRVADDAPCLPGGTQGRCAPTSPADAADLHEMGNCFQVPSNQIDFIGYSVRTTRWRYTEWLRFNGTLLHGDFGQRVANELYDHAGDTGSAHDWDAFENENVAADPANADTVAELRALLMEGFRPPMMVD